MSTSNGILVIVLSGFLVTALVAVSSFWSIHNQKRLYVECLRFAEVEDCQKLL